MAEPSVLILTAPPKCAVDDAFSCCVFSAPVNVELACDIRPLPMMILVVVEFPSDVGVHAKVPASVPQDTTPVTEALRSQAAALSPETMRAVVEAVPETVSAVVEA